MSFKNTARAFMKRSWKGNCFRDKKKNRKRQKWNRATGFCTYMYTYGICRFSTTNLNTKCWQEALQAPRQLFRMRVVIATSLYRCMFVWLYMLLWTVDIFLPNIWCTFDAHLMNCLLPTAKLYLCIYIYVCVWYERYTYWNNSLIVVVE